MNNGTFVRCSSNHWLSASNFSKSENLSANRPIDSCLPLLPCLTVYFVGFCSKTKRRTKLLHFGFREHVPPVRSSAYDIVGVAPQQAATRRNGSGGLQRDFPTLKSSKLIANDRNCIEQSCYCSFPEHTYKLLLPELSSSLVPPVQFFCT